VGSLVGNRRGSRASVADLELKGLAGGLAMGVGRRHCDRTIAVVAVGWHAGDDSSMSVDLEASPHRPGEGQGIGGGWGCEMAGNVERNRLTFIGSLVCDRRCRRTAVADLKLEGLADRLAVRIGRGHSDRMIAVVAVSRYAGDDACMGVEAEA